MNNKFNKILDFEREKAKKGLDNKYRTNTRNNKFGKVHIYSEQW